MDSKARMKAYLKGRMRHDERAEMDGRRAEAQAWYEKANHTYARKLADHEALVRAFDESKVKRGGNQDNPGQFSSNQGPGAQQKPGGGQQGGQQPQQGGGGGQQPPEQQGQQGGSQSPKDAAAMVRENPDEAKKVMKAIFDKEEEWTEEEMLVAGGIALERSRIDIEDKINLTEYNKRVPEPPPPKLNLNQEWAGLPPEAAFQNFNDFPSLWNTVPETSQLFLEMSDMGQGITERMGAPVADLQTDIRAGLAVRDKWMESPKGACVIVAPNKKEVDSIKKVKNRLGGNVSELNDLVRGTVAVPSFDDAQSAYDSIVAEAEERGWQIVEQSDNITKPKGGGYRDINLRIRAKNGHVVEMQINTAAMLKVKDQAHDMYKVARKIGSLMEKGQASTELGALHGKLTARMSQLYGYAYRNSFPNRAKKKKEAG